VNTLDLALKKVKLRKVSSTKGGEWQGPCPGCGEGTNRFHVWPYQHDGKGSYWCRVCEKAGDNIQFLIDFDGLTFKEACASLNITLPDRSGYRGASASHKEKPDFSPSQHIPPADLWQEKAQKFIAWARGNLTKNTEVLSWLDRRGISAETAADYYLGWNPGEDGNDIYRNRGSWGLPEFKKDDGKIKALWIPRGLVIPNVIDGVVYRIRIRRPEGEPRYYVIPGSSMSTMILERTRRAFVVVESELDAIAVVANNLTAGAVGLGSSHAKPDAEAYEVLKEALQILISLDYDDAGRKALAWWKAQFDRCDRWPVPQGKDPGEAYGMGIDLDQWIQTGLPPVLTMETIKPKGETIPQKAEAFLEKLKTKGLRDETIPTKPVPPLVLELRDLLLKNPGVKIINTKDRFTALRHGKYVGGRIGDLIFRSPEVMDYIMNHPSEEIDGQNIMCWEKAKE